MSESTFKLSGWQPQSRPAEGPELEESRRLIREVIFSKYFEKKLRLAEKGWSAKPVSLAEIFKEVESRVESLRSTRDWSYPLHEKRWWDRRVNEVACKSYYADGVPKVVSVSAGWYEPNKVLFVEKSLEVSV